MAFSRVFLTTNSSSACSKVVLKRPEIQTHHPGHQVFGAVRHRPATFPPSSSHLCQHDATASLAHCQLPAISHVGKVGVGVSRPQRTTAMPTSHAATAIVTAQLHRSKVTRDSDTSSGPSSFWRRPPSSSHLCQHDATASLAHCQLPAIPHVGKVGVGVSRPQRTTAMPTSHAATAIVTAQLQCSIRIAYK
ncbi:hypothetical protein ACLOJK_009269 [Asimina triloba]